MLPCEEDDVADRINAADIMHRQFKGHPAKCVVERDSVRNAPPGVEIRRCTAGVRFGTSSAITPKRASVVIGIISATKTTRGLGSPFPHQGDRQMKRIIAITTVAETLLLGGTAAAGRYRARRLVLATSTRHRHR